MTRSSKDSERDRDGGGGWFGVRGGPEGKGSKESLHQGATTKGGQKRKETKREQVQSGSGERQELRPVPHGHAVRCGGDLQVHVEAGGSGLESAEAVGKYLKDHRRVVLERKYQELPKTVVVWSDNDFAGCGRT